MEMNEQTDVTVQLSSLTRAVGQDGKKRPTSVEGVQLQRARIGEMITAMPDASDRQIAREIGCSPSTVSGVRKSRSNQVGHLPRKAERKLDTVQPKKYPTPDNIPEQVQKILAEVLREFRTMDRDSDECKVAFEAITMACAAAAIHFGDFAMLLRVTQGRLPAN